MKLTHLLSSTLTLAGLALAMQASAATLTPGTLIKGPSDAVYYYAANGKRLVFPNFKTYQTWYTDFSSVTTISLNDLSALSLGGNVTYRPGVRLVKVTTDPKVYAVAANGMLRWVQTEAVASALYGADWNKKIDDLPDEFFVNYSVGSPIVNTADYSPSAQIAAATDIDTDKKIGTQPPPVPTPTPTPTSTTATSTFTFSASQMTVQPGDVIALTGASAGPVGVQKIELFFDGTLIQTCPSVSCSGETQVPLSGTKPSYVVEGRITRVNATVESKTLTLVVQTGSSAQVKIKTGQAMIQANQMASAIATTESSVNILHTDIYVDEINVKGCGKGISTCQWTDYLTGAVGSVHQVYAIVTDTIGRTFRSQTVTITIGVTDSPSVTISTAKSQIYAGETVDVTVFASDNDGIASIDVMKDGVVLKNCIGGAPCTATTGPWLTAGTVLHFTGRATDTKNTVGTGDEQSVSVATY